MRLPGENELSIKPDCKMGLFLKKAIARESPDLLKFCVNAERY